MPFIRRPGPCGLYNPDFEKDSCGVGFIANIKGKQSHRVVEDALHILCRMDHRGARGAEENTGDGAGILTALPDSFLRRVAAEESGITLPAPGQYAAGIVFLPVDDEKRHECKRSVERVITESGQLFLGWRTVPVCNDTLGPTGRNFAAGMSGGIAWVYDPDGRLAANCNREMVSLEPVPSAESEELRDMIVNHQQYTGSETAGRILGNWEKEQERFVRVIPEDYKIVMGALELAQAGVNVQGGR
ncbi:MAG TPA: hypothetical protein PLP41_10445 [Treponemataceae bacterium]|nr:hypothetical protein [Treponemataceae bacterium]HOS36261.1 hypothetical protein [Treponemataceae bacterium]HPL90866.1 hypothetical protein [Treponemataceae bacterium]